jgi:peptide/nickel transport system ATP-binding protein
VLLCDEPTSALDVSLAATVLNLLGELRRKLELSMIFVTHDLAAARIVADRVAVMYLGKIVELGPVDQVVENPGHPYTRALLAAVPELAGQTDTTVKGDPASPMHIPSGCPFHPRCPLAIEDCRSEIPELRVLRSDNGRLVSCIRVERGDLGNS